MNPSDSAAARQSVPWSVYLLLFLLLFLSVSGFVGGLNLLLAPAGNWMLLPVALLARTPFPDYLVPGLLVLLFHGVFPLFVFYALLALPNWQWPAAFNLYRDEHWAWTFSLYSGISLIVWVNVQTVLIGYLNFVQTFYSLLGMALVITTLLPSVKSAYARKKP